MATVRTECTKESATELVESLTDTLPVRVGLPIIIAVLVALAPLAGGRWARRATLELDPKKRLWYLDYARTFCVMCVVMQHSETTNGPEYAKRNVFFVTQWVMSYLFTISGIGYMFSNRPLHQYLLRLLFIFAAGHGCNSMVAWFKGQGPASISPAMGYVVLLMLLAIVLAPVKAALRERQEQPTRFVRLSSAAILLLFLLNFPLVVAGVHLRTLFGQTGYAFLGDPLFNLEVTACAAICMLGSVCVEKSRSGGESAVGWLLLVTIYVPRLLAPRPGGDRLHHSKLFMLGMQVHGRRLLGQEKLVELVKAYWPLIFGTLLMCVSPETTERCDQNPPSTLMARLRHNYIEAALAVILVTGCYKAEDPYGVAPLLNMWSLFAFITHQAFAKLSPGDFPVELFILIPLLAVTVYLFSCFWADEYGPDAVDSSRYDPGSQDPATPADLGNVVMAEWTSDKAAPP